MSIEELPAPWPKSEEVDLEKTLHEVEQWRKQKENRGHRMPDALSIKIVILSKRITASKICSFFGISGAQLKSKIKQFEKLGSLNSTPKPESIDFQEVKVDQIPILKQSEIEKFVQAQQDSVDFPEEVKSPKLKLDRSTMVVELFNGNKKMAIHITQESLPELMDAFFSRSI